VDYGLIPLINLIVAFLWAGLVVLAVARSPLRAASCLIEGAFGLPARGHASTLFMPPISFFTALPCRFALPLRTCSTLAARAAYVAGSVWYCPAFGFISSHLGMFNLVQLPIPRLGFLRWRLLGR